MHTAGAFAFRGDVNAPFSLVRPYFEQARHAVHLEQHGTAMTFERLHRPLQAYSAALENSGFAVTCLRSSVSHDYILYNKGKYDRSWRPSSGGPRRVVLPLLSCFGLQRSVEDTERLRIPAPRGRRSILTATRLDDLGDQGASGCELCKRGDGPVRPTSCRR